MFLFWNRFPRFTRYNRNSILSCRIMTYGSIPFNRPPSLRLRIWYTILTFCRCSLTIFIYLCILLRLLEIYNIINVPYKEVRDFSLMVKHVTFNHYNMGSNPIAIGGGNADVGGAHDPNSGGSTPPGETASQG